MAAARPGRSGRRLLIVPRVLLITLFGLVTAPFAVGSLVLSAAVRPFPSARDVVGRWTCAVAAGFAKRDRSIRNLFGEGLPDHPRSGDEQVRYMYLQSGHSVVLAAVLYLTAYGLILAGVLAGGVARGRVDGWELVTNTVLGLLLLFLAVQGIQMLVRVESVRARDHFGLSERERMLQQIRDLNEGRAAVLEAVDTERRRIERDLHDGLQQRLVATGLLIAQASRGADPRALLREAAEEIDTARQELREVSWSIYPAGLHQIGLEETLLGLSQRSPVPVTVRHQVTSPMGRAQEAALYFVTAELVTNANKHAGADEIVIEVFGDGNRIELTVTDDGSGGADPRGTGLMGIRSRVEAGGGTFSMDSPQGGPTTARAVFPCG
ncbi:two-component sensor histidine kinase [Enemella evansiae]|uniref:histidine kinase n=1 Tax=Enemella evansiae TaxID=2016499 RepID=A0A255GBH9_9ACTN|nr:two-component sensor histidine kinase [Enemella evansiae]